MTMVEKVSLSVVIEFETIRRLTEVSFPTSSQRRTNKPMCTAKEISEDTLSVDKTSFSAFIWKTVSVATQ